MAKVEDITVEVKANMTVDKTTAEACLKLVELYIDQNDVDIIGNTKKDGTIELNFQKGDIVHCRECKHWKDSDGVYRRGFCAESKCRVNCEKVMRGDWFCADGERRTDG